MEVTQRDRKRIKTPLTIKTKPLGQAECLITYETKPSDGDGKYWVFSVCLQSEMNTGLAKKPSAWPGRNLKPAWLIPRLP